MTNILICNWKDLAHPRAGGAEVYTQELARRWVAMGHRVTLFAASVQGAPGEELVDGVRVIRRGGWSTVYRAAERWFASCGEHFDLIIDEVNTRPFGCAQWPGAGRVVALVHQVAREIWRHEVPLPAALVGRYVLEPRWLQSLQDVPVVTVSESSADSLRHYGIRDVTVLPQGCTLPAHRPQVRKETDPTFVFVGRLAPVKQPFHVLEAMTEVRRYLPRARLWMIGTGPLEARLRAVAGPGVHFFGRLGEDEKFNRMAAAHALLVTSIREGWGMVVSEAAAVGTRSIGYSSPGLVDSIRAAEGILVPPSPAALAALVVKRWPALKRAPGPLPTGTASWDVVADRFLDHAFGTHELATQQVRHVA